MTKIDLSIIIACYNEGPTFGQSVNKVVKVLKSIRKSWEIIFVEDKSTDETKQNVEKISAQIKNSKAIYHNRNLGRGKSVSDGIMASRSAIVGYLDVDLEVSADYIPLFVNEIDKGFDVAVGKRFYESNLKSIVRFLASKVYAFMVRNLLKTPIEDTEAGCKFFRRAKILPILRQVHDKHWFWDTEICARSYWAGLSISQIPVLFIRRNDKKSTVRLIPDTWAYMTKIIKFRQEVPRNFVNG